MSSELREFYDERRLETQAYLDFLQDVDDAAKQGAPRVAGAAAPLTPDQVRILHSSLFLQLYNLTEATVSRCLGSVVDTIAVNQTRPMDLNVSLRNEWVRAAARTHVDLNSGHRLEAAMELCEVILTGDPIGQFKLEVGGGGNWDDDSMERMWSRLGCSISYSPGVLTAAKRPFLDDLNGFRIVRKYRNDLAHGSLSFVECSNNVTVQQLKLLASAIFNYLDETVNGFDQFNATGYLMPGGGNPRPSVSSPPTGTTLAGSSGEHAGEAA